MLEQSSFPNGFFNVGGEDVSSGCSTHIEHSSLTYVHPKAINACFSIFCYEESHVDSPNIECD